MVKRVKLRQHAKFRGDRSNRGSEMLRYFDFSRWQSPLSWIFELLKFLTVGRLKRVELHRQAKFCRNPSSRGRDMAIDFSRWRPPPAWIFQI